jgi:8-oxo-dGTP pyrophosphatase MutT (NUDIX family)
MVTALRPGIDYTGVTTPFYCNDGNGNFLLHKRGDKARDEKGRWDFGGAGLEKGEELEECVIREVKEEWGVDGTIQDQLPAHLITREQDGVKTYWVAVPFFVKVEVNKARIMEPDKFSEMGVFDLNHLPQPLHSGVRYTMDKYPDYFDRYKK